MSEAASAGNQGPWPPHPGYFPRRLRESGAFWIPASGPTLMLAEEDGAAWPSPTPMSRLRYAYAYIAATRYIHLNGMFFL